MKTSEAFELLEDGRPSVRIRKSDVQQPCPHCGGTGQEKTPGAG
jgi:hypothetical protein